MRPDIAGTLARIIDEYPPELHAGQRRDLRRAAYHAEVVTGIALRGRMVDIGGGVGIFIPGCADLGMDVVLVDDMGDSVSDIYGREVLKPHAKRGVEVLNRDAVASGLGLPAESVDLVTTFDSMEHWHASPKALFHEVMTILKPGGHLLIGVPNCVNLRKRITVPLGRGKWSQMVDWYERPTFRGHVREPDVDDLRYIAADIGLVDVKVWGRNWQGYVNPRGWVRRLTPVVDLPLRLRPSLCSDLYMLGRKP